MGTCAHFFRILAVSRTTVRIAVSQWRSISISQARKPHWCRISVTKGWARHLHCAGGVFLIVAFAMVSSQSAQGAGFRPSAETGAPAYVINLESALRPLDPSSGPEMPDFEGFPLYTTQFEKDGETWHRLRLGFFASESAARQALERLRAHYPQAWVATVSPGKFEASALAAIREAAPASEVELPESGVGQPPWYVERTPGSVGGGAP